MQFFKDDEVGPDGLPTLLSYRALTKGEQEFLAREFELAECALQQTSAFEKLMDANTNEKGIQ